MNKSNVYYIYETPFHALWGGGGGGGILPNSDGQKPTYTRIENFKNCSKWASRVFCSYSTLFECIFAQQIIEPVLRGTVLSGHTSKPPLPRIDGPEYNFH
jgi:hypothetical protein